MGLRLQAIRTGAQVVRGLGLRNSVVVIVILLLIVSAGTVYWLDTAHTKSAISDASQLVVGLRLNATTIHPDQHMSFAFWVNNTSSEENNVTAQDRWALPGLKPWGCSSPSWPLRFGFVNGNYVASNISRATFMPLSNPGFNCSAIINLVFTSVSFRPLSSWANLSYYYNHLTSGLFALDGTETIPGAVYPSQLTPGKYTIVAGDEWGHVALAHFTMEP